MDDTVDHIMWDRYCEFSIRGFACNRDLQYLQLFEDRFHRAYRVPEKFRAADAREGPTHAFQHDLPVHVFGELFKGVVAITIALNGQAPAVPLDNQIDPERSNP